MNPLGSYRFGFFAGPTQVHSGFPYQGTKYNLSGHSSASTLMFRLPSATPARHATPHAFYWTSVHYTSVPCQTQAVSFLDQQNRPFSGPSKLLFLSSTATLGGRVRTQRFSSVPRRANGNRSPRLRFPPASHIIRHLWPGDYLACHLVSRWNFARLIRP
jgi:hypothetical protein